MAPRKGIEAVAWLRQRTLNQRGGNTVKADSWDRTQPDALALCRDAWLQSLAARNYAEGTIEGRRDGLKVFLIWAHERELTQASQITRPILEAYQRWLSRCTKANGKPLGWSTQRARLGDLKEWFRWITRQNILVHNPASELELPRVEKRLHEVALTLTEITALLAVPNILDPLGLRDRAMLEVFYSTGLRRSELCRLELTDYHPEPQTLHIRLGKGRKDRFVPIGEQALYWTGKYLAEVRPKLCLDTRTAALFLTGYGGPFNADVLSRLVSKWMAEASLSGKGSCHLLRHTCATHMLEGGADIRYIQQLLGHEKLETTAIYTEVNIRQLREVHRRCHPSGQITRQQLAAAV